MGWEVPEHMETQIRRADEGDIDALARLYVEFHNFHAQGVPSRLRLVDLEDSLPGALREILANPKAAVFVACCDGMVCGFVEIYLRETEAVPAVVQRKYAHLQSLAVTSALRKHGIGKRLVEAAHQWAESQGATSVELDVWEFTAGPLHFYESLGYGTEKRTLTIDLVKSKPLPDRAG